MDRNLAQVVADLPQIMSLSARRAWIEITSAVRCAVVRRSLSARRAWIEMRRRRENGPALPVALRKESVDRNSTGADGDHHAGLSLSARRAWIEIAGVVA